MGPQRSVIVNADDFGYSRGVNRGIVEAYEDGVVTSASLMVGQPGAQEAAAYARAHPGLGVGLHIELRARRRWMPPSAAGRPPRPSEAERVSLEVRRQLERFHALMGRAPTHLDSHRHRHRREPARSAVAEAAGRIGVPARQLDARIAFCGDFYGQTYGRIHSVRPNPLAIGAGALIELLERLTPGVTELCCHPGYADDLPGTRRVEPYREERAQEVRALCDRRVRAVIERLDVRLCTFADLPAAGTG